MEGNVIDMTSVAKQFVRELALGLGVPKTNRPVVTCGGDQLAIWADRNLADRTLVGLEGKQWLRMCTPIRPNDQPPNKVAGCHSFAVGK